MTVFNVRDYAAIGDGIADDTVSIQAAIAAAEATWGAVLYFPAGRYKITAPLSVNPRQVVIYGDGPQASFLLPQLTAGEWALTLGWDNNIEVGLKWGPYTAVEGLSFYGTTGTGQSNGLRMFNASSNGRAHSLTLRDVGFYGFDIQVDLCANVYLVRFDRCFFSAAQTYAVRMDDVTTAGENVSFDSCVLSGSPGTLIYLNKSGASFYLTNCSLDYSARALWQRGGQVAFSQCHFETGTTYGGTGKEYLLVDRRGWIDRPSTLLTDCRLANNWDNYDTFLRLHGDHGEQALRIINPWIKATQTMCPYLVRDDGPVGSSIMISDTWYTASTWPYPKLKPWAGADIVLAPTTRYAVL